MARFLVGVVAGMVITTVAGAALELHAQSDDVETAAAEAGVNPEDLRGAVNTTGLDPYAYLRSTGELSTNSPVPRGLIQVQTGVVDNSPRSGSGSSATWAALARCESNGNAHANTGNGYYGLYQEDLTFWHNHGGLAYAARPDLATPAQQLAVAQRGLAVQGPGAWPVCGVRVGL